MTKPEREAAERPIPVTYRWLRHVGFRIHSTNCSHVPHMVLRIDRRMDTAIEVAEGVKPGTWSVWLRSDLAHSRCRFCFLRQVETCEQVERLIEAITDESVVYERYDPEQFDKALAAERKDAVRRYAEYCKNERYSYVPS